MTCRNHNFFFSFSTMETPETSYKANQHALRGSMARRRFAAFDRTMVAYCRGYGEKIRQELEGAFELDDHGQIAAAELEEARMERRSDEEAQKLERFHLLMGSVVYRVEVLRDAVRRKEEKKQIDESFAHFLNGLDVALANEKELEELTRDPSTVYQKIWDLGWEKSA